LDRPETDGGVKIWWVQCEALNTWSALYRITGASQRSAWKDAIDRQWAFIHENLIDPKYGGWTTQAPSHTGAALDFPKSGAWIDPYHNLRAIINTVRALSNGRVHGRTIPNTEAP
jgi:N-acyl-D-glucosamine 2-epimerase